MFYKKKDLLNFINITKKALPNINLQFIINKNNLYININKKNLKLILNFFKLHINLNFNCLIDIVAIDLLYQKNRFNLIYVLTNYFANFRIFIKTSLNKFTKIDSINKIFYSANWLEREIFDLFGIFFKNHIDLRRILNDYGFKGYPLRKDFPLIGYFQLRYDELKQKLIYEKVTLIQKYRFFSFLSPRNLSIKKLQYKIKI